MLDWLVIRKRHPIERMNPPKRHPIRTEQNENESFKRGTRQKENESFERGNQPTPDRNRIDQKRNPTKS